MEPPSGLYSRSTASTGSQLLKRTELLSRLLPSPVFVNSVILTLADLHPDFIRVNAWPGYLESALIEAAANAHSIEKGHRIFGENILFVKDVPGLVNPRILSMIINEAFYTLHAGTATRPEIDTAMKLGTGYPLGPFEWAEKIGRNRVAALLTALGRGDPVYGLAPGVVDG
jgi:3-hydroxybutyryl-CoA dehydrogenase